MKMEERTPPRVKPLPINANVPVFLKRSIPVEEEKEDIPAKEKKRVIKRGGYPRKSLSVTPNINMKVAMGDDLHDLLVDDIFNMTVVRVAVIDQGMSLYHSILKAINLLYQRNNEYLWRRDLVNNLKDKIPNNLLDIVTAMKIGVRVIVPYDNRIEGFIRHKGDPTIILSWNMHSWEPIAVSAERSLYRTVFKEDDPFVRMIDSKFL